LANYIELIRAAWSTCSLCSIEASSPCLVFKTKRIQICQIQPQISSYQLKEKIKREWLAKLRKGVLLEIGAKRKKLR